MPFHLGHHAEVDDDLPPYNNTVMTLSGKNTPDPWMIIHGTRFYMTFTAGDHIEMWEANTLPEFRDKPTIKEIWRPDANAECQKNLWAPELHNWGGRWYIYFAAEHAKEGNKSHRTYVLQGPSAAQSPMNGPWQLLGKLRGMPKGQWNIDSTIFELHHSHYLVYSGWPFDNMNDNEDLQKLFIVRMADPITVDSEPTMICRPDQPWEVTHSMGRDHAICEGPEWLESPRGDWKGLIYSCAGSWSAEYKMAVLHYNGMDPLDPSSWRKRERPLLQSVPNGDGPYGPGHGSFIHIGAHTLAIYHATDHKLDGWDNRKARVQQVVFDNHGPYMGDFVGHATDDMTLLDQLRIALSDLTEPTKY